MQDDVEVIESYGEDESAWEWTSLSVPVYKHSSRKNICFYLNIQLSFAGSSVANISPALPQIHIGIDGIPIGEDDYFYTFPISKSEQEANFINIEQSSLLKFNYDSRNYSRNYWQYSIKLLSVNAANLEELIIFPIVQLLNEDTWNIKADSALDKALIRYENENLVFKD